MLLAAERQSARSLKIGQMLNELEVLRVIHRERRPTWGGQNRYSYEAFRQDIGMALADRDFLSDSQISSLLNGRPGAPESKLLERLSGSGDLQRLAKERIESSLGLPGLFRCHNRTQVLALINEVDSIGNRPRPEIKIVKSEEHQSTNLIDEEHASLKELVNDLVGSNIPAFHWASPFHAGVSNLGNSLGSLDEVRKHYDEIAYVRPSNFEFPFDQEFGMLANYLETKEHVINTRSLLIDAIRDRKMLVVVYSAFCVDSSKDASWLKQAIKELKNRSTNWVGPAAFLIVGESSWVAKKIGGVSKISTERLHRTLRVRGNRRFEEFKLQWARFGDLRGNIRSEESGSRVRRMATYYSILNKKEVWPVSIKIRALFASNFSTFSYFDPTQGFNRLAGQNFERLSDIDCYHQDIREYIGYQRFLDRQSLTENRGARTYYYNLQYVSTALNWLTDEALLCLLGRIPGVRQNALRLETEISRISTFLPVINRSETVSGIKKQGRFFAGQSIKAVVQDLWASDEPYERSLAHWRIAKRLLDNQHDKELLPREFPYPAHWGRSRIFFLGEAIRHLVRSCETSIQDPFSSCAADRSKVPDEPQAGSKGTSQSQVINYCFETIFQQELNGNVSGRKSRKLAKQYGAYHLAVELLELMSENHEIGEPNKSLLPESRVAFVRECAFALFDIGELARAEKCFERAIGLAEASGSILDVVEIRLDLALLKTVSGAVGDADVIVDECLVQIAELHYEYSSDSAKFQSYLGLRKMFRRAIGRSAHLRYVKGDVPGALHEIERISSEQSWEHLKVKNAYPRNVLVPSFARSLQAEQEHLLIACLMSMAKESEMEALSDPFGRALDVCIAALMRAQSAGLQHEAMGFRIVLARLMRRMGRLSTAEIILDVVHSDILKFGCSERTFLAFLNAAGKVLSDLGDPLRAFATYLWPCMWRASSRGFNREAVQAARSASQSLERCLKIFSGNVEVEPEGERWSECVERALAGHQKLLREAGEFLEGGPFEKDPLYAYAIVDAENLINSIKSEADFRNLQSQIDVLLKRHST